MIYLPLLLDAARWRETPLKRVVEANARQMTSRLVAFRIVLRMTIVVTDITGRGSAGLVAALLDG